MTSRVPSLPWTLTHTYFLLAQPAVISRLPCTQPCIHDYVGGLGSLFVLGNCQTKLHMGPPGPPMGQPVWFRMEVPDADLRWPAWL